MLGTAVSRPLMIVPAADSYDLKALGVVVERRLDALVSLLPAVSFARIVF